MRPAVSTLPAPTDSVVPKRYVVPKITGDPAAAYRLAAAYRELADSVSAAQQRTGHVVGDLSRAWRGRGQQSIDGPVEAFLRDASGLARRLHETATELDTYGRRLEKAQHHHGFSLHKLIVVGAVVAVGAAAIVVTVGAAGVVEAAAATAAVGGATEAAGAAVAADAAAASGIDAALDGMSALRPLLAFVVPHLVQVEWAAGGTAIWDEVTLGRLKWRGIAESGAIAFVASGAATKATSLAGDTPWLSPNVIQGTAWAGAAAGDDAVVNHRFSLLDVSESFVLAGGGTLGRDALRDRGMWPAEPDYRRQALVQLAHHRGLIVNPGIAHELAVLRQPVLEIRRGEIDLRLHEGPGHTIDRHIGKTASELLTRVRSSRIPVASTYWDDASARDSIRLALSTHDRVIQRWIAAGTTMTLRLHVTVPYDVGFAINAHGRVTFVRQAIVILRRDNAGIVLRTSYPLGRR